MEKTKLGVSVGLLAAVMYLMGLLNLLGLLLIAGYVLFCESNVWLRKSAVKAVLLYAAFALVSIVLGVINDGFGILNTMIGWFFSFQFGVLGLDNIISYAFSIIKAILFLALAGLSLKQKTIPLGPLDRAIEKHL